MGNLFDDDEFSLNEEDLEKDTQLSIIDEAKLRLVKSIQKTAKSLEENIKFNEKSDGNSNLNILNGYLNSLTDLYELESNQAGLSEEEIYAAIEEVEKSTTEITLSNIETFIKEESESGSQIGNISGSDDGDDLGW